MTSSEVKLAELKELTKSTGLHTLREATQKLTAFSDVVNADSCVVTECQQLNMVSGTGVGFGLFKDDDVAIARYFLSSGSVMAQHFHGEREIVGVMSGQLIFKTENEDEVTINRYESYEIPPGKPHTCLATEDTWIWVVTMPASKEFPNAA